MTVQQPRKEITDFKFRFCLNGKATSIFAAKGNISAAGLTLGDSQISWDAITDTTTRDDRLLLVLDSQTELGPDARKNLVDGCALVLAAANVPALDLERTVDRWASDAEVARTKARLQAEGRIAEFRTATCPKCDSVVNLSSFAGTHHISCRFCDTVFESKSGAVVTDSEHRTCSECNLFDRVRGYTEFYFYFLLVIYGFSYKRRHLCDGCAGRLFWKVFLINAIFVLGVPPAVWLKVKSLTGRNPKLKNLADANAAARKGNLPSATKLYAEVLSQLPEHPGVLLNQAHAHINAGDTHGATVALQRSLQSCANYGPSLRLVQTLAEAAQQPQLRQ